LNAHTPDKIMKINFSENLANQIVLIDGLTRCGKSSLCQMIVSLKDFEHVDMCEIFETVMSGLVLKKIPLEFAKPFIRNYFNQSAYNKLISRGVNFRPTDFTGIQNFRDPKIYVNRLKIFSYKKKNYHYRKTHIKTKGTDDFILKTLKKKKQFFPYQSHLILCDFDKFIKLKLNYKIIEIFRSPIDNAISLINRNVFEKTDIKQDPRRFDFDILHKKRSIPWHTYHYADKFLKANNAEKCALFVINQTNKIRKKKKIIHPYLNKKVLIIKFENLVTSTEKELKKISKFLNTSVTSSSKKFIKNANCPRTINPKNKLQNILILKKKIKNKAILKDLFLLEEDYQKNLYNFKN
jgi:hypothetical protein